MPRGVSMTRGECPKWNQIRTPNSPRQIIERPISNILDLSTDRTERAGGNTRRAYEPVSNQKSRLSRPRPRSPVEPVSHISIERRPRGLRTRSLRTRGSPRSRNDLSDRRLNLRLTEDIAFE